MLSLVYCVFFTTLYMSIGMDAAAGVPSAPGHRLGRVSAPRRAAHILAKRTSIQSPSLEVPAVLLLPDVLHLQHLCLGRRGAHVRGGAELEGPEQGPRSHQDASQEVRMSDYCCGSRIRLSELPMLV